MKKDTSYADISLKNISIESKQEISILDEEMDIPSEENYDSKQVCKTMKRNYIKSNFFQLIPEKQIDDSLKKIKNCKTTDKTCFSKIILKIKKEFLENDITTTENTNGSVLNTSQFRGSNFVKVIKRQKANKNWNILLNVIQLINRTRNVIVRRIRTAELDNCEEWFIRNKTTPEFKIKNFTLKNCEIVNVQNQQYKIHNDAENIYLDFIAKQSILFVYLKSGSKENFEYISNLIKKDPNRFIFNDSNKHKYFVNQRNEEFLTPLYIATINGHLNFVKLLVENGSDHLMKNGVIIYFNR